MSTNEENFSKKLREKLDDQAWPMPEAAWQGAQALIAGDKRRKRAGLVLFTLGLLLIMAGLLPFVLRPSAPALAEKSSPAMAVAPTVTRAAAEVTDQDSTSLKKPQQPTLSREQPLRAINVPQVIEPKPQTAPVVQPKLTQALPSQPVKVKVPKVKAPSVSERPSPDNANGLERNQVPQWAAGKKEMKKETEASAAAVQPPPTDVQPLAKDVEVAAGAAALALEPAKEEVVAVTQEMAEVLALTPTPAITTVVPATIEVTPKVVATNTDVLSITTPSVNQAPQQVPVPLFSMQGGIGLSPGWKDERREGAGVAPDAGVMWYVRNDRKSYFGLGVHYTALTGINTFTHTSYTTVYGLGEQSSVKKISPFKVHYLMVPLRYFACVGDKLVWGVGMNALYLLTTNSHVEEYNTVNGVAGTSKKYDASGYTEGFNWYDLQGAAELRYRVMNRWWAGASLYYGFADLKNAFLTNNTNKERAMGIRLNLVYMIPRQ
jgi:hypothetical protein